MKSAREAGHELAGCRGGVTFKFHSAKCDLFTAAIDARDREHAGMVTPGVAALCTNRFGCRCALHFQAPAPAPGVAEGVLEALARYVAHPLVANVGVCPFPRLDFHSSICDDHAAAVLAVLRDVAAAPAVVPAETPRSGGQATVCEHGYPIKGVCPLCRGLRNADLAAPPKNWDVRVCFECHCWLPDHSPECVSAPAVVPAAAKDEP